MLMDPSGGAAGVSSAAAAPSLYTALVSTTLPTLCRGKAAVSFPAAAACSTAACVPTAECAQCVPTLQHCSMTPPCSSPCPGCCEETAHALTMHCIALLLVCTAGQTLLPLHWCYLLWMESIDTFLSKKVSRDLVAARSRLINTDARWQCPLAHCVQRHHPSVLSAVPTAAPLPDLARWWPSSGQSHHTWGVEVIMDMAGHPRTIVNILIEGNKNGGMLFYFCYFMD